MLKHEGRETARPEWQVDLDRHQNFTGEKNIESTRDAKQALLEIQSIGIKIPFKIKMDIFIFLKDIVRWMEGS